ncbi:hypothetical protein CI238_04176 [Colletotrichum incanum]|uniref:Rhodopsin domain-containing protein n=1 Tax=Colletotrichum incanum TaxID=1573173 RepID=A0A161XZL7_COLIC|nr:hypothetical protein CI238_04176 [Colletotrichum incanum]
MASSSDLWHRVEPQGLALSIVVTGTIFIALTTVVVAMRSWVRFRTKNAGIDDLAMIAGYMINIVHTSVVVRGCFTGVGSRDAILNEATRIEGLKSLLIWQASYSACLCFIKASISITLMRITKHKVYHRILSGLVIFCAIVSLTSIVVVLNQCHPLDRYWDKAVPGTCLTPASATAMSYISSAVNVTTDISVATIPIFLLRHIQMRPQLKLYIQLIFGLGLVAGVASIVRLGFTDAYMDTTDFLHDTGKVVLCTVFECGLGIIAGSLPILRTFFARLAKDYSTDAEKGHHSGGDETNLVTFSHYNVKKEFGSESDTYVTIAEEGNESDGDSTEIVNHDAKSSAAINQQAITVTTDLHQTSDRVNELKSEEMRTTTEVRVKVKATST